MFPALDFVEYDPSLCRLGDVFTWEWREMIESVKQTFIRVSGYTEEELFVADSAVVI